MAALAVPLITQAVVAAIKASRPKNGQKRKAVRAQPRQRQMIVKPKLLRQQAAPVAYGRSMVKPQPSLNGNKSSIRIVHQELVATSIVGTEGWSKRVDLLCNPGNPETFPWLASLSSSFEFYKFNRLRFLYVPLCASTTVGSIQMAPDYDSADVEPVSENVFAAFNGYVCSNAWMESSCDMDPKFLNLFTDWHYTSDSSELGAASPLYAAARFYLYTNNFSSEVTAGKIYVEYDVELKVPTLNPLGNTALGGQINCSAPTSTAPFAGANNTGCVGVYAETAADTHSHIIFQKAGRYSLVLQYSVSGGGNLTSFGTLAQTVTSLTLYKSATGANSAMASYEVVVGAPNEYVSVTAVTATAALSTSSIYVGELPL
jgi:hypothetical protein